MQLKQELDTEGDYRYWAQVHN